MSRHEAPEVFPGLHQGGNTHNVPDYLVEPLTVNVCWSADQPGTPAAELHGFADTELHPTNLDQAREAFFAAITARAEGRDLVVRCQMGWNRSGLIVAGVLIAEGMKPENAIALVRHARGRNALSNPHFEQFLLDGGFTLHQGEPVWYCGSLEDAHGPAEVMAGWGTEDKVALTIVRNEKTSTLANVHRGNILRGRHVAARVRGTRWLTAV